MATCCVYVLPMLFDDQNPSYLRLVDDRVILRMQEDLSLLPRTAGPGRPGIEWRKTGVAALL